MGKYIAKRLGYMVVVALILSLLMFLVYTMIPYDRAVVEVDSYKASLKNNPNAGELYEKKLAEKRHELGTDQNVFIRYLGWVVSSALSIGAASGTRRCRWVRLSVTRYLYSSRPSCLSGCSPLFSAGSRCRA